MSDIIKRLENVSIRFATESEADAKIRRNKAIEDAITVIAALEAENQDLRSGEYLLSVIEQREKLRKALEPFANGRVKTTHSAMCGYRGGHDCDCGVGEYFLAARAALSAMEEK